MRKFKIRVWNWLQRLHERSFTSIRFQDFETASKSLQFVSVYTELFPSENRSRDGLASANFAILNSNNANFAPNNSNRI